MPRSTAFQSARRILRQPERKDLRPCVEMSLDLPKENFLGFAQVREAKEAAATKTHCEAHEVSKTRCQSILAPQVDLLTIRVFRLSESFAK